MTYVMLDDVKVPVGKIVCLLRSYRAHAEEMGAKVSDRPEIFLKPRTALVHDGGELIIPPESDDVHHEVELAVIIGKGGKAIAPGAAMKHVMGYAVMVDATARDVQAKAKEAGKPWTVSKGFDTFAPISDGVMADKVRDPHDLGIWLKVNSQIRQESSTSMMIYSIPDIVSHISGIMTLEEGDIIATGTPEGVGPLKDGDVLEAGIDYVGELTVKVRKIARI